jgi:uncharacterized metal-binding protein
VCSCLSAFTVTYFTCKHQFEKQLNEQALKHNLETMELQRNCTNIEAKYIQHTFKVAEVNGIAVSALQMLRKEYGHEFSVDFDNTIKYVIEGNLGKAKEYYEQVEHEGKITR